MEQHKRVYFIGIGGIGMSGLARLYLHEGAMVWGSDIATTANTERLMEEGARIVYEQKAENIADDLDLVIYTEAIAKDNPELVEAKRKGVRTMNYFEALGEVANEYYLIAISGTHGKTTTTAMLIDILEEASFDPTAIVGSLRSKTGSNFRPGKGKYFIVEACEYRRDFLSLTPDLLVITNIEFEHVDYYKDLDAVKEAFYAFGTQVREGGAIVANFGDPSIAALLRPLPAEGIDYAKKFDPLLRLRLPGIHNRMNAAAAKAAAEFLGIEEKTINDALENFAGTARRFEYKGDHNGAPVYDDYAHHPTEIAASIAGARELYPEKKLTVIFQPHTFSRTQELLPEFVAALAKADRVIMLPVYAARAEEGYTATSEDIVERLKEGGVNAEHFMTREAAAQSVADAVGKDDVVLVMGAGDVTKIARLLTT
jgi:UDP-N-acetylmuramate--alanine ligase